QIVASGNRAEGTGVIVEASGVVDPRRLRRPLTEPRHAFDGVVEPPGRTELYRRVMSCQWRKLTRIRGFVEREEHQREVRVVAELVEQRAQIPRVLRGHGDVGALVSPKLLEDHTVVVAERAGVQLHNESVLHR